MEYDAQRFSQTSYDENDPIAKKLMIKFLEKKDYIILTSEENYDHDIIAFKNGKYYYFELEMKHNYPFHTREDFQYNTVSFLSRKRRLHNKHRFIYVIICAETNYALYTTSDKIYKELYSEKLLINKPDRKGLDKFYRVPKTDCKFFNLN